jgi:prevent-host-death family protein
MESIIITTEAARHLGTILSRVKVGGERFVITRRGKPVACLVPFHSHGCGADIMKALVGMPYDPTFADDLERVNRMDCVRNDTCFTRVADLEVRVLSSDP